MGSTVRISMGLAAALAGAALLGACGSSHVASNASGSTTTTPATIAPGTTTGSSSTTPADTPATTSSSGSIPPATTRPTPTTTRTAATGPAGCVAGQLNVVVSYGNGAAGSIGYTNSFQNISSTTCTLFGYPGMQMLGSSGQPIQTDVIRGTSVTVPSVAERLVTLAPGGKAWFDMGYSDGTGYGYDTCPTSTLVEFTAPNDFQSITVSLQIQPYGGATIAQLHCGEIHVSPVFAAG